MRRRTNCIGDSIDGNDVHIKMACSCTHREICSCCSLFRSVQVLPFGAKAASIAFKSVGLKAPRIVLDRSRFHGTILFWFQWDGLAPLYSNE